MNFRLDTTARRIALAIGVSVLLHGFVLWGPNLQLPQFRSSMPPLVARLEALPNAPAKPKPRHKAKQAPKPEIKAAPAPQSTPAEVPPLAASAVAAASATPATETLAQSAANNVIERPTLPRRAQLFFSVYKGTSNFKIGEVTHTLQIDEGRYKLQSVTETVGLAKLFKTYKITQYSNGSYSKQGLLPDEFLEERGDKLTTLYSAIEFDHANQRARFADGREVVLPPGTQDILSILYQFPPLAHTEIVTTYVSNGKKVEHYEFEVAINETIHTAMGELRTVHLRKVRQPNEEGLELWLAQEYRLFPVKMRIIEKNGDISGEVIITDIRAEFEEETKKDAAH